MARPHAEVLTRATIGDETVEILASEKLWCVCYRGVFVSIKKSFFTDRGRVCKYPKFVFPHEASARSLAERLNKLFETDEFTWEKLTVDLDKLTVDL